MLTMKNILTGVALFAFIVDAQWDPFNSEAEKHYEEQVEQVMEREDLTEDEKFDMEMDLLDELVN